MCTSQRRCLLLVAVLVLSICANAKHVTISNVMPRRDTSNRIMDAHDGKVLGPFPHLGNRYLWYAASYGNCTEPSGNSGCKAPIAPGKCGFQLDHNVSLWSSHDLETWTPHGPVFQCAASGLSLAIMFCPKVLYNAQTDTWVMWVNAILGSNFGVSYYAVATAKQFTGPFELVSKNVSTLAYNDVGDFNLFQDDNGNGTAYVIYTSHIQSAQITHRMSVEQLSPDYTSTMGLAGNSGFFGSSFVEAPALFKHAGTYFAVFGQCCCYCEAGSPVYVYIATHPLGPYSAQSTPPSPIDSSVEDEAAAVNSGRAATTLSDTSSQRSSFITHEPLVCADSAAAIHAQQTDITSYIDADGQRQFIWIGDRWQQAPDGIKGHDPTYWGPLRFSPGGDAVLFMSFLNNFTISIRT